MGVTGALSPCGGFRTHLAPYQLEAGKNTTYHAAAFGFRCLTNSPANPTFAGHFEKERSNVEKIYRSDAGTRVFASIGFCGWLLRAGLCISAASSATQCGSSDS